MKDLIVPGCVAKVILQKYEVDDVGKAGSCKHIKQKGPAKASEEGRTRHQGCETMPGNGSRTSARSGSGVSGKSNVGQLVTRSQAGRERLLNSKGVCHVNRL